MAHWAGLGYYAALARNLHACAQAVMRDWQGRFPARAVDLATLPGIGRTAGAIAAFCAGERAPIPDGNAQGAEPSLRHRRRSGRRPPPSALDLAQSLLPTQAACRRDPDTMASYTQGLMDLGATVCTRSAPDCAACPRADLHRTRRRSRTRFTHATRAPHASGTGRRCTDCPRGDSCPLERRAPKGLGSGLWSLPEFEAGQDPRIACEAIGVTFALIEPLATLSHTFTHFRLMIHPWLVRAYSLATDELFVPAHSLATEEAPAHAREWISVNTLNERGMPAPVRKLLLEMVSAGLFGK